MFGWRICQWVGAGVAWGLLAGNTASGWQFREVSGAAGQELKPTAEAFVPPEPQSEGDQPPDWSEASAAPAADQAGGPVTAELPEVAVEEPDLDATAAAEEDSQALPVPVSPLDAFKPAETEAPEQISGIHPYGFNAVVPGVTPWAQVQQRWGRPAAEFSEGDATIWHYQLPGYEQIALVGDESGVTSAIIHLRSHVEFEKLAARLQLTDSEPVDVTDADEGVLGRVYPEHGVVFAFAAPGSGQAVAQIILEPITAEPFRLRAEKLNQRRYEKALSDLETAVAVDPRDGHSHWLRAELLLIAGESEAAVSAARRATELEAGEALYKLTLARAHVEAGEHNEAQQQFLRLANDTGAAPVIKGMAEYQLGDLKTRGPDADFHAAMDHHLRSIDVAATLIDDPDTTTRRLAKHVLVRAHLAVAVDVAMGHFQRKPEVVPKWLTQATELAEDYIQQDEGDPTLRMHIFAVSMESMAAIHSKIDPSIVVADARTEAYQLLGDDPDPIYQRQVASLLAETFYHAARLHRVQLDLLHCKQYAEHALALINSQHAGRDSLQVQCLKGQLHFLIGSYYAVQHESHQPAVQWYAQALEHLDQRQFTSPSLDVVPYGEMLVSMGVSYWENGQVDEALELTEAGVESLEAQVKRGQLDRKALIVPYNNLSAMHAHQGHAERAKEYSERIAELPAGGTRRR